MRIAIDARMVSDIKFGIARYVVNLVKAISRVDQKNQYVVLVQNDLLPKIIGVQNNIEYEFTKIKWLSIQDQLLLPLLIRKIRPDVFHATSFVVPLFQPCRTIVTVHDLIHMVFPADYGFQHKLYYQYVFKKALKSADKIIAISKHTKSDLISFLGIEPKKIEVIYEAADEIFKPIKDGVAIREYKKEHKLPDNYILYVGNRKSHKNLPNLFESFRIYKKNDKLNCYLVVTGPADKDILSLAVRHEIENWLVCVDKIDDQKLVLLYNSSQLFVYPSLYEGFGLPPLEAMACGTPVIVSNASSLPEIVADAGILVDARSAENIAEAMACIMSNNALAEEMGQKGLARSKLFSWEKCALETIRIYEGK